MTYDSYGPVLRGRRRRRRAALAVATLAATVLSVELATPLAGASPAPVGAARAAPGNQAGCAWTVHALPVLSGDIPPSMSRLGGRVFGTDGGRRFAGYVTDSAEGVHAAVWQDGRLIDLGFGTAADVNRNGVAVGLTVSDYDPHAHLWRGGTSVPLAEPAGAGLSAATAVNDAGLVVGWAEFRSPDPAGGSRHAVVWSASSPGRVRDLGVIGSVTELTAVTEQGRVVGFGYGSTDQSYAVTGTPKRGLRILPGISPGASVAAYGAAGRFTVGSVRIGNGEVAVLWTGDRPVRLAGGDFVIARAVNSAGTVVGDGYPAAVVWNRGGEPTALPALVPEAVTSASAVTEDGRVGGTSWDSNGPQLPLVWSCG